MVLTSSTLPSMQWLTVGHLPLPALFIFVLKFAFIELGGQEEGNGSKDMVCNMSVSYIR